jgi:hypothetical protein
VEKVRRSSHGAFCFPGDDACVEPYLAAAAGEVYRIGREGRAREEGREFFVQIQARFQGNPEVIRSRREIKLKKIIGAEAQGKTFPEKDGQGFGPVVDAPEQHGLNVNGEALIDAGRQGFSRRAFQFPGMIDVHRQAQWLPAGQERGGFPPQPRGRCYRDSGTEPEEDPRPGPSEGSEKGFQFPVPGGQGVAA